MTISFVRIDGGPMIHGQTVTCYKEHPCIYLVASIAVREM